MLHNVVNLPNFYIRSTTVFLDISAYRLLSNMLVCEAHTCMPEVMVDVREAHT